jgi:hypothetical protein
VKYVTEAKVIELLEEVKADVAFIKQRIGHPEPAPKREWSVNELTKEVDRTPFTIREWCRKGQIPSRADSKGRRWISDDIARKVIAYGGLPPKEEITA